MACNHAFLFAIEKIIMYNKNDKIKMGSMGLFFNSRPKHAYRVATIDCRKAYEK